MEGMFPASSTAGMSFVFCRAMQQNSDSEQPYET